MFGIKSFTDTTHTDHGLVPPQEPRSFNSFDEAAGEAAVSRLYGGIHYGFDNSEGLFSGHWLGDRIRERIRVQAPTLIGRQAALGTGEGCDRYDLLLTFTTSVAAFPIGLTFPPEIRTPSVSRGSPPSRCCDPGASDRPQVAPSGPLRQPFEGPPTVLRTAQGVAGPWLTWTAGPKNLISARQNSSNSAGNSGIFSRDGLSWTAGMTIPSNRG